MIAHRLWRIPSDDFFCSRARRKTSTQQLTDLPEPTGPLMPRKNVVFFMKAFITSPSGLYLNSAITSLRGFSFS
jgi:hypothetical protein